MKLVAWLGAIFLSGCAQPVPLQRATASGFPEGRFEEATIEDAKSRVAEACIWRRLLVEDTGGNQVVCSRTLEGGQAFMATMLLGNRYSTDPVAKVRFTFVKSGSAVTAYAQQWVETQMAMGQVRKADVNDNATRNGVQAILDKAGAK